MTAEPHSSADPSVLDPADASQALAYARDLLDAEQARAARMELQAHRMVIVAWPWFAVVQAAFLLLVINGSGAAGDVRFFAYLAAAAAALGFLVLLISAHRFAAVPDDDGSLPASLLESLLIGNAGAGPVDQTAVMIQVSSRRLNDRRMANTVRAGCLRELRAGWLWTMVAALAELAATSAVIANIVSA